MKATNFYLLILAFSIDTLLMIDLIFILKFFQILVFLHGICMFIFCLILIFFTLKEEGGRAGKFIYVLIYKLIFLGPFLQGRFILGGWRYPHPK